MADRALKKGPLRLVKNQYRTHVLLTSDQYRELLGGQKRIVKLLAMPEVDKQGLKLSPSDSQNGKLHPQPSRDGI